MFRSKINKCDLLCDYIFSTNANEVEQWETISDWSNDQLSPHILTVEGWRVAGIVLIVSG